MTNTALLPNELREQLDRGEVTIGMYRDNLPALPTAALVDHAEVYLSHCRATYGAPDPADPASRVFQFMIPELIFRMGGQAVTSTRASSRASGFVRSIGEQAYRELQERIARANAFRDFIASHTTAEFVSDAEAMLASYACPYEVTSLVYDATLIHIIVPELLTRLRATS
jgi:hypothetical protein